VRPDLLRAAATSPRLPAFVAILLWYALQLLVFVGVRPELAYSLHHRLGPAGRALPALTAAFALPVLGPGGLDGRPGVLFHVFWALVFLPPAVLAWRTWREASEADAVRRFVYWGSCYAVAVALAFLLVAFGLWLPFSAA
jgi:hypothetical protein